VATALITLEVFVQYTGLIVHDTRLDINLDPVTFIQRTWNLWEPFADMGRIQNQAVGYLFPMGPFFVIGHFLHVPTWIIERSWIALILGIALWGAARLADELEIGTPLTRLVGAIAFALTPCMLARVGTTSGFELATAFLPWTIVPLIRGARGGSPRRAACLSGLAVLCMGGINGVVTLAVLAMPALYLVTRQRGPRRAKLMRWWVLAVFFASSWWLIPLLFQGKYGVNFLIYTEQPATTTAFTPLIEVIRGTADWLSYFHLHGAYLPAGFALAFSEFPIIGTTVVAAAGLFGLARRDLPERRFLVLAFLGGVALVGAGYGGPLGDPFAPQVLSLLTNLLAAFRSVYKFEPLIALPMALGGMHGLAVAINWLGRRFGRSGDRPNRERVRIGAIAVAILVVMIAAMPLFTNDLLNNGPFRSLPSWWIQADHYLERVPGRVLLAPGESRGFQNWGFTEEDPLYPYNKTPWASRSIAPLGSRGANLYLDAVEAAIEDGGDTALPAFLARGGFSTVLVHNDGDWQTGQAPPPLAVNNAMIASGLKPVASFGPTLPQPIQAGIPKLVMHQIEIYSVGDTSKLASYPVSSAALLSGGQESPMTLLRQGFPDEAYILASDWKPGDPLPKYWIITDGNRRRFLSFGLNRDYGSYVLTAGEAGPNDAKVSRGQYPEARVVNQTVAIRNGVKGVDASSSGSWITSVPSLGPGQVLDGDPTTAWSSGPDTRFSDGEWIRVDLLKPISVSHIQVRLLEDGPWRPAVHALRVTTESGSVVTKVKPDQSLQSLNMPRGPASTIKVAFEATTDLAVPSAGAGIRDILIPGIHVVQMLKVPSEFTTEFAKASSALPVYAFERSTANPHSLLAHDEERSIRRLFTVPKAGRWEVSATASSISGSSLLDVLDHSSHFTISASSTVGRLPEFAPHNLLDALAGSIWVSSTAPASGVLTGESLDSSPSSQPGVIDRHPTISMKWNTPRTLNSLVIARAAGFSWPTQVVITDGHDTRLVPVRGDGVVQFQPMTTTHVEVTLARIARVVATDDAGDVSTRPVALTTLRFPALDDLAPAVTDPTAPLNVSCAAGPSMVVGNQVIHFSIKTTMAALTSLEAIDVTPCTKTPVSLAAGDTVLTTSMGSSPFDLDTVTLAPPGFVATTPPAARAMTPVKWGDDAREVRVGSGAASYLVVNENHNIGWKATLDGKALRPVTIDGWRQGFVVPAGAGGVVKLVYGPNTAYQASLVLGFLLVVALACLAFVPSRRYRSAGASTDALQPGTLARWIAPTAAILCGVLVTGLGIVLLVPLWLISRWRSRWPAAIAFVSFTIGGVYVALTQSAYRHRLIGAFSYPANVLAAIAFLAVGATLLPRTPLRRRGGPRQSAGPEGRQLPRREPRSVEPAGVEPEAGQHVEDDREEIDQEPAPVGLGRAFDDE
jgi:arabinofuranan 3-O-arabinosyltransferase